MLSTCPFDKERTSNVEGCPNAYSCKSLSTFGIAVPERQECQEASGTLAPVQRAPLGALP